MLGPATIHPRTALFAAAFMLFAAGPAAHAAPLHYNGHLTVVEPGTVGGMFFDVPLGTAFRIRTSNLGSDGSFAQATISGGGESTPFHCPSPVLITPSGEQCSGSDAGPSFSDDEVLDVATADLLNNVFGTSLFFAGQQLDLVNVEGDLDTPGGRIEVGFTFISDPGTYTGDRFGTMVPPFDPSLASQTLFFVTEEEDGSGTIYSGLGDATPVEVPLPAWVVYPILFGVLGGLPRTRRPTVDLAGRRPSRT